MPTKIRRELLASHDPNHRHAGRLLQAIAGEPLAELRSRAVEGGELPAASAPEPEDPVEAEPEPPAEADMPEDPVEPEPEDPVEAEPEPEPEPEPTFLSDYRFGPELLLLRERPPVDELPDHATDGPRLLILTSLALQELPDGAELRLGGAGPAELVVQPLDSNRVRLSIIGAGTVPAFLSARPALDELLVVDVARRGSVVELELEYGARWRLGAVERLDNGARVRFERG